MALFVRKTYIWLFCLSFFAALQGCAPSPRPEASSLKVIYGNDSRQDLMQLAADDPAREWAQAVALLIGTELIKTSTQGQLRIDSESSFGESMKQGHHPLCEDELFQDQPDLSGFCTGFLIGPQSLVTAAHCMPSLDFCGSTSIVFGLAKDGLGPEPPELVANDHYRCQSFRTQSLGEKKAKVIVLELDRPVLDRRPLVLSEAAAPRLDASLTLVAHPLSLPLKVVRGGKLLEDNGGSYFFKAAVSSYTGASGSPLIDESTGQVEGVLQGGETDFVEKDGCWSSRRCAPDGSNCAGETFTRVRELLPHSLLSSQPR